MVSNSAYVGIAAAVASSEGNELNIRMCVLHAHADIFFVRCALQGKATGREMRDNKNKQGQGGGEI